MGSGFSKMKKQAKQFQDQLAQMQEDMQKLEVTGTAGNGLVEITLSGEKEVKKLSINPECVDPEDVEGLQDLIIVAFNDAVKKIEENSPGNGMEGLGMGNLPFGF
ncbi:MAG: YbaB/EbfC family nucleoid-associated protein [Simkaniaceae bacterium]|jgi:DNA-binding YbaB/EbfC family protein|uniref:YbaB/EbfC family nucleoid-associated protein n=1 Tax=Candidatus Neptunichlamydia sp. REUL1 TaxID=3064277 RepID=UPI001BF09410|nr:YbaB/EbfC family nucleoid-associated protein [Candidatus Neptunochlamydia sp. REUL1]QVL56220.1 MAG: YbaB/EbfC family nucleoid-associated protein [Simkaniaceae bacterium]